MEQKNANEKTSVLLKQLKYYYPGHIWEVTTWEQFSSFPFLMFAWHFWVNKVPLHIISFLKKSHNLVIFIVSNL